MSRHHIANCGGPVSSSQASSQDESLGRFQARCGEIEAFEGLQRPACKVENKSPKEQTVFPVRCEDHHITVRLMWGKMVSMCIPCQRIKAEIEKQICLINTKGLDLTAANQDLTGSYNTPREGLCTVQDPQPLCVNQNGDDSDCTCCLEIKTAIEKHMFYTGKGEIESNGPSIQKETGSFRRKDSLFGLNEDDMGQELSITDCQEDGTISQDDDCLSPEISSVVKQVELEMPGAACLDPTEPDPSPQAPDPLVVPDPSPPAPDPLVVPDPSLQAPDPLVVPGPSPQSPDPLVVCDRRTLSICLQRLDNLDMGPMCSRDFVSTHSRTTSGEKTSNSKEVSRQYYFRECQRAHRGEKPPNSENHSSQRDPRRCRVTYRGKQMFECILCGKKFSTNETLEVHKRRHAADKPFHCMVCGEKFSTKGSLRIHKRTHIQCMVCGKKFLTNDKLKIHQRIHTGAKPFQCLVCGHFFSTKGNLETHHRAHTGEKPFECVFCGKKYSTNDYLKTHHRIHSGEKPFICVVCGKKFATKDYLKQHHMIHTGEKPFECVFCGKKCASNLKLKAHHRIHTGEKPFECIVCGKKFSANGNLDSHQRTHTGEKPFQCLVCGHYFSKKNNLKTHHRIHTGDKPFECVFCGKKFSRNRRLKIHQTTHTGDKPSE